MDRHVIATLKIPAGYLEDFRSAVVREIVGDSDTLQTNHQSVLDGRVGGDPEDRTSAATALRRDMGLLDQVLHATDETTVKADSEDITFVLEEMVRLLAARLDDLKEYGPINLGAVLEIAEQLRWAAENGIAIDPRLDQRKAA
jgi:hypothetical protein